MNYLPVEVYKNNRFGDCTNGGVTSFSENNFVVPCQDGWLSENEAYEGGYVMLEVIPPAFTDCPIRFKEARRANVPMFGGNFVHTSDSRFSKAYGHHPIAVHDRFE